jgi:ectoine hydroxylase-related dioxygenase (phytanoyl-CoA dioxygenase family)
MPTDYSTRHEIVSSLFSVPEDLTPFRLTDNQVAFFHEHGYLSGVKVLDAAQIASLRSELETFFDPDHEGRDLWYEYHTNESTDPDRVLFHALGAWRVGRAFHDLLWHPAVTVPASQLLDGGVRFWHDQLFCKPARHGGVVAWHQDYSYWTRTKPLAHLTMWIALDDATVDNGCVKYVPGSHRWPLLPMTTLAGDLEGIRALLNDEQNAAFDNPVPAELKAGYATFHHAKTLHGSDANSTDQPRRATVINMVQDGVCSDSDEPLLTGVPPIPKGEPLAGRFFPLTLRP